MGKKAGVLGTWWDQAPDSSPQVMWRKESISLQAQSVRSRGLCWGCELRRLEGLDLRTQGLRVCRGGGWSGVEWTLPISRCWGTELGPLCWPSVT